MTKAQRAAVSLIAKGCTVARVLPLRCILLFTTQLYQYFSVFLLFALFSNEPEVLLP